MRIYFAGSIRGGREDQAFYAEIVRKLESYGKVFTEHVADANLTDDGELLTDKELHDRDLSWLSQSDLVVAEVTQPSLGVGYELGKATEWRKPVLCLFRANGSRRLSAMIGGCNGVVLKEYGNAKDLDDLLAEFFSSR